MEKYLPRQMLLAEWFHENSKKIFKTFLWGVVLSFGAVYGYSKYKGRVDEAYLKTAAHLEKWENNPSAVHAHLEKIGYLVDKHPTLHAAFDAAIAQTLINHGNGEKAKKYASGTLDRIEKWTPNHAAYGRTSLLIASGEYAQAYKEAVQLKDWIEENHGTQPKILFENHYAELYAHNLLRICTLCERAGDKEGEIAAWTQFEKTRADYATFITSSRKYINPFMLMENEYKDGHLTLSDYIQHRIVEASKE